MVENSPMCFEEKVRQFGVMVATASACWIVQYLLVNKTILPMLVTPEMVSMYSAPAFLAVGSLSLFAALFFLNRGAMLGVSAASVLYMSVNMMPKVFESPRVGFFVTLALVVLVSGLIWYQIRKEN